MDDEKIHSGHSGQKDILRALGPIILGIGILFTVIGFISFFVAFGGSSPPKLIWAPFVGIPLIGVGSTLCKFGYMGKIARYTAQEMAPVAKDTFNYMADGTMEGVKTIAQSIGQGLAAGTGSSETKIRCYKCNNLADVDAKFCDACGSPLVKSKPCLQCQELNDPDAKFCDNCGAILLPNCKN